VTTTPSPPPPQSSSPGLAPSIIVRWHIDDLPRGCLALADTLVTGPGADLPSAVQLAEQARDDLRTAAQTQPWLQPTVTAAEQSLAR
jgi:hypothetical protein